MNSVTPYIIYILAFTIALFVGIISVPRIIYITKKKKLFDKPDNDRKLHVHITPNLGGVGIFFAYIIVACFFLNHMLLDKWNYIIASSILLFLTGINDDLVGMSASKKFLAQLIAAVITVCFANDIRISSLHGMFGIYELPYWSSIIFTTVGVVFVTNAFNLIDGIDGLAGSIGALCTFILGICLAALDNIGGAVIAFSLLGAILGFLRYNIAPAKIFMGDTGSMLMGFNIAVLSILFIHSFHYDNSITLLIHSHKASMLVALAILFIPVFDSFRVFTVRILKGHSPFRADRTHLHHFLLDAGFTHTQTVGILVISNILIITTALLVQDTDPNVGIASVLGLTMILFGVLYYLRKTRLAKNRELIEQRAHKNGATPSSVSFNGSIAVNAPGADGKMVVSNKH